jgi:hypothetical protein
MCDALEGIAKFRCKDQIYDSLARKENSLDTCYKIQDVKIHTSCKSAIESVLLERKQVSIAKGDTKKADCDTYSDQTVKEECKKQVNIATDYESFSRAVESSDTSYCDSISDAKLK